MLDFERPVFGLTSVDGRRLPIPARIAGAVACAANHSITAARSAPDLHQFPVSQLEYAFPKREASIAQPAQG